MEVVSGGAGACDVEVAVTQLGSGTRVDWSVANPTCRPVHVDRVGLKIPVRPHRVLEHGWQSWSPVRWCTPDDVKPERLLAPRWRRAMYHADGADAGRTVGGDQFLVDDRGITGFLAGDRHLATVTATAGSLIAWALLDGVPLAPGEKRDLHPVWLAAGDPAVVSREYASHWASESNVGPLAPAHLGWCSWYRYAADITPDDVLGQLDAARAHGVAVVQIDDGWQRAIGDWTSCAPAWTGRLESVAADIRNAGRRAGIWTAPFLVGETSTVFRDHPDWVLHDGAGPVEAMHHPTLWGGWTYALDLTHPDVHAHLRDTFTWLRSIGFDMHKLDFLYAGALPGTRHDRSMTRAEALRAGLMTIRDALREDAFLLGCGCPLAPAVGLVDAMRVSPDVTPRWDSTWHVTGYDEAAPCAGNAVRNSALRAALHGLVWTNDADCALIRSPDEARSQSECDQCDDVVAATGFVTLSDDLREFDDADWARVRRLQRLVAHA